MYWGLARDYSDPFPPDIAIIAKNKLLSYRSCLCCFREHSTMAEAEKAPAALAAAGAMTAMSNNNGDDDDDDDDEDNDDGNDDDGRQQ